MTVKELIKLLEEQNPDMPVEVSIPEVIFDDGYVSAYRRCAIDGVSANKTRPTVSIDYDRTMGVVD